MQSSGSSVTAAAVLLVGLLAGCFGPGTPQHAPTPFAGDAAHALLADFLAHNNGTPRFRVPGTQGHAEAAQWLAASMQVAGWDLRWQNFTGADYSAGDKGGADFYYSNPGYCSQEGRARLANLTFHNLWAVHDASPSDRLFLLGAHWESKRFANQDPDPALRQQPVLGANDGAAGVALLLQFMRHVVDNDVQLPFDVGVAFFDGEDGFDDCHPLAGSTFFVQHLAPGEVDRFLLLDMVGDPAARFVREAQSDACDPALVDLLHAHAPASGLQDNFPNTTRSVSDDHVPFLEAGIPAVDLIDFGRSGDRTQTISGFPPYWHTTHDTLDKVEAGMLGRVGDLVLTALADERLVEDWPASC